MGRRGRRKGIGDGGEEGEEEKKGGEEGERRNIIEFFIRWKKRKVEIICLEAEIKQNNMEKKNDPRGMGNKPHMKGNNYTE